MIVYAESSAVLAWLLGEPRETALRHVLDDAERVITSSLTAVECARAIARGVALGRIRQVDELASLRLLDVAAAGWDTHDLSDRVLARAQMRFPSEPVRTLDALHLATALLLQEGLGSLPISMLALDDRVRENAERLGFRVLP